MKKLKFFNNIGKFHFFSENEKYTVGMMHTEGIWEPDDGYYVFKNNIPMIRFDDKTEAKAVAYLLNQEVDLIRQKNSIISQMAKRDTFRKKQQRILEAKIRRLKDRIKVFEKNCDPEELKIINKTKRWKKP